MAGTPTEDLFERLKNPEYAKLYGEENAKVDFAITMARARKSLNLTQRRLAEKLGVSQPYIAKLERGEANPTLGAIGRLLAPINLRLITRTAPLKPEPVLPRALFTPLGAGAGHPTDPGSFLSARRPAESLSGCFTGPTAPGTLSGGIPYWWREGEPREAVGGAAR